jgi:hypothetical protein
VGKTGRKELRVALDDVQDGVAPRVGRQPVAQRVSADVVVKRDLVDMQEAATPLPQTNP